MATYKNKSVGAHVHDGKVIAPGGTFDAQPTKNLGKLVKANLLEVVSGAASAQAGTGGDGEDKAALVARAKELGVPNAGANWGVEKLKDAIAAFEAGPGSMRLDQIREEGNKKDA
ncbi:TPA: hypothetical protein UOA92_000320 [Stenotrophomonas maltophilia]|nr:hypothetical protein [Stenotrophomonas maltophilia]